MRDLWYKSAVIYGLDVETFADGNGDGVGDFAGLTGRLAYLAGLGVTCIWLLPFYPTPNRDNGYDISDYFNVDPRLGTLGDFVQCAHEAAGLGLRIIADLVVNHTSNEHPWFKSARKDPKSPYRDWYVWSKKRPPHPEKGVVFPGPQKGIWSYDSAARMYYLHRFYDFQPDLNVANPEVREEIQRIMGFWLQLGVNGFRVDAAPFLIETLGVPGQKGVDPYLYLQEMHDFLSWRKGDAILMAEANVPMAQIGEYFRGGERMNVLYNFAVNRNLFAAFAQADAAPLRRALRALPALPEVGQWGSFLRNADEVDLSQLPSDEFKLAMDYYAPDPDMQLYDRGARRRLAPMLHGNPRRIALAFSLMFSLPGTPIIYYGDEIGMGDDLSQPERNSVRTPMQWSGETNGGFSTAPANKLVRPVISGGPYGYEVVNTVWSQRDPQSIHGHVERLIRTYKQLPALGWGSWEVIDTDCSCVLAQRHEWRGEGVLVLHNLSESPVTAHLETKGPPDRLSEVLSDGSGYTPADSSDDEILIEGYGFRWFRIPGPRPALSGVSG